MCKDRTGTRKVACLQRLGLGGSEKLEKGLLDVPRSQLESVTAVKASSRRDSYQRYLDL